MKKLAKELINVANKLAAESITEQIDRKMKNLRTTSMGLGDVALTVKELYKNELTKVYQNFMTSSMAGLVSGDKNKQEFTKINKEFQAIFEQYKTLATKLDKLSEEFVELYDKESKSATEARNTYKGQ